MCITSHRYALATASFLCGQVTWYCKVGGAGVVTCLPGNPAPLVLRNSGRRPCVGMVTPPRSKHPLKAGIPLTGCVTRDSHVIIKVVCTKITSL